MRVLCFPRRVLFGGRQRAERASFSRRVFAGFGVLFLFAQAAGAFQMVPGSFTVTPYEVLVSERITVRVAFEDEQKQGSEYFGAAMTAEPSDLVVLEKPSQSMVGVSLTCSQTGRLEFEWVFRAVSPGDLAFNLSAGEVACRRISGYEGNEVSAPVRVNPIPIWSSAEVSPRVVDTDGVVELRVALRNDSPIPVEYLPPDVREEAGLRNPGWLVREGKPGYDPPEAFAGGRMRLDPGVLVSAKWRFRAKRPGESVFLVSAAGLLFNSPSFKVRDPAVLVLDLSPVPEPSAVGRRYYLRGSLRASGGTGVDSPELFLSWTPAGAASLLPGSFSSPGALAAEGEAEQVRYGFALISPGIITFTVSAQGIEADTGRTVASAAVVRKLKVLSPPDLDLRLTLDSTTVFAGRKVEFGLDVANRGVGVANLSPVYDVRRGIGLFGASRPLFVSVEAEKTVSFRGSVTPVEPGVLEFVARVDARGQVEGNRVAVASEPASITVVPFPEFAVFALNDRIRVDTTAQIRFLVKNVLGTTVTIDSIVANLGGPASASMGRVSAAGGSMRIGPAQAATVTIQAYLPPSGDPYPVTGSINIAGKVSPYELPFDLNMPSRFFTFGCPWAARFTVVEPPQVFLPPVDLFLYVEFSVTRSGDVVLAVVNPQDLIVRTILGPQRMEPGWHSALWRGDPADGRGLVRIGNYVLRLAGVQAVDGTMRFSPGERWIRESVSWQVDYPVEIRRP